MKQQILLTTELLHYEMSNARVEHSRQTQQSNSSTSKEDREQLEGIDCIKTDWTKRF
jgi:hypothetical protein